MVLLHAAKNYWAKDLIFLVTTRGEIGMQSWIDGYMGTVSSGELQGKKRAVRL